VTARLMQVAVLPLWATSFGGWAWWVTAHTIRDAVTGRPL
jgi:hypothetical protein